jgi:hypothetical protein
MVTNLHVLSFHYFFDVISNGVQFAVRLPCLKVGEPSHQSVTGGMYGNYLHIFIFKKNQIFRKGNAIFSIQRKKSSKNGIIFFVTDRIFLLF